MHAGGTGLIDLGEDRSAPTTGRSRRRVPPSLAAVLAVVAALVVTGGSERVTPGLVPLAEVPVTRSAVIALTAGTVFLGDWSDAVVDGRRMLGVVSAYPLPGDAPRWQARLPVPAQLLRVAPGAGVVLATTAVDGAQTVTALDAGTGRVLWRADSLAPLDLPADSTAGLFYGPGGSLHWVDLRTGRDVWSRPLPPYGDFSLVPVGGPTDRTRVLTVSPDGWVEVVDEATGALVASGPTGEAGEAGGAGNGGAGGGPGGSAGANVDAVLGRILVTRPQPAGSRSVTALDPTTLHPLWTVVGAFQGVVAPCGDLLCLSDANGLTAVDPASGATAWHTDAWDATLALDHERLVALTDDPGRGLAVLRAGDGAQLLRLTGWTTVDDPTSGQPVLVTRPDATGGSLVARLDPGRNRPTVLRDLPDAAPSTCWAAAGVLACATVRHTLRLWRYSR